MARYVFTNGNYTQQMRLGLLDDMTASGGNSNSITIDNVVYYARTGYFNVTAQKLRSVPPAAMWDASRHSDNSADGDWVSGSAQITVQANKAADGWHTMTVGKPKVFGSLIINHTVGQSGTPGTQHYSVWCFKTKVDGYDGVLMHLFPGSDPYTAPNNTQGLFLSESFFTAAQSLYPYDGSDTEYPGGSPDGGYGEGARNIGDVSAGTLPTHPIKHGYGLNYMLVSDAQLSDFSNALWGRNSTLFQQLWNKWQGYKFNPMAGIISCHALPTDFYPTVGGTSNNISIAGESIAVSCTDISSPIIQQTYTADMTLFWHWNNFLDYTRMRIIAHIPFCGECEIDPATCVGGSITFVYRCDALTGNVACWVCPTDRFGETQQVACLTGNCAYIVPITGNDNGMTEIIGALKSSANSMLTYMGNAAQNMTSGEGDVSDAAGGISARPALDALTARHHTSTVGNLAGSAAIVANNHLFLDITYASPSYPDTLRETRGTPSDIGGTVGKFAGHYVEFSDVHTDGINNATEEEKRMIEHALKTGVYV